MSLTFTFSVPTLVGQTDEARRAKGWRAFEKIMREGVWWFGPAEVKGLLKKITTRPKRGRPAEEWINGRLLEEYDAAVREAAPMRVNKAKFARNFCNKYPEAVQKLSNPEAVQKRLDRLLKTRRDAEAKKKS
jgi:hypothetical protein